MRELRTIFDALQRSSAPAALATLVRVEGSSYRRTGARLLWRPDAPRIGSISGGCLEEDLAARCHAVVTTGRSETAIYDTSSENDEVWGVGLGCHGIVHVLIERIEGIPAWMHFIHDAWARGEAVALASFFGGSGPSGAVFALSESGQKIALTTNVGSTDDLFSQTRACLERTGSWSTLQRDGSGSAGVFFEYMPPPIRLAIFGAGDDARPLVRMAAGLGWRVTVLDPRSAYATAARFPEAEAVIAVAPADAVARAALDSRSLVVVMTHHYVHDVPLLGSLLSRQLAYLGLLGPKKRAEKILADLESSGTPIAADQRARLRAPVGLDLGADTPEEVALAILAEMQAVLRERDARPLRERSRPIHDA